jgi:hypothetical protein
VVGALSVAYGVLLGLFWAWVLWRNVGTQEQGGSGGRLLVLVVLATVPILLVVAGYGLCSVRVGRPDAQALKVAAVVVLAVKAAVVGYWAVELLTSTVAFSGLLHSLGWTALVVEVVPSGVWATVLALTSIPTDTPPDPEKPLSC